MIIVKMIKKPVYMYVYYEIKDVVIYLELLEDFPPEILPVLDRFLAAGFFLLELAFSTVAVDASEFSSFFSSSGASSFPVFSLLSSFTSPNKGSLVEESTCS